MRMRLLLALHLVLLGAIGACAAFESGDPPPPVADGGADGSGAVEPDAGVADANDDYAVDANVDAAAEAGCDADFCSGFEVPLATEWGGPFVAGSGSFALAIGREHPRSGTSLLRFIVNPGAANGQRYVRVERSFPRAATSLTYTFALRVVRPDESVDVKSHVQVGILRFGSSVAILDLQRRLLRGTVYPPLPDGGTDRPGARKTVATLETSGGWQLCTIDVTLSSLQSTITFRGGDQQIGLPITVPRHAPVESASFELGGAFVEGTFTETRLDFDDVRFDAR